MVRVLYTGMRFPGAPALSAVGQRLSVFGEEAAFC